MNREALLLVETGGSRDKRIGEQRRSRADVCAAVRRVPRHHAGRDSLHGGEEPPRTHPDAGSVRIAEQRARERPGV